MGRNEELPEGTDKFSVVDTHGPAPWVCNFETRSSNKKVATLHVSLGVGIINRTE